MEFPLFVIKNEQILESRFFKENIAFIAKTEMKGIGLDAPKREHE